MSPVMIEIPQPGAAGSVETFADGRSVAPAPRVVRVAAREVEQVVRYARPQAGMTGEVLMVDGTRHQTTDVDQVLRARLEAQRAEGRRGRRS